MLLGLLKGLLPGNGLLGVLGRLLLLVGLLVLRVEPLELLRRSRWRSNWGQVNTCLLGDSLALNLSAVELLLHKLLMLPNGLIVGHAHPKD